MRLSGESPFWFLIEVCPIEPDSEYGRSPGVNEGVVLKIFRESKWGCWDCIGWRGGRGDGSWWDDISGRQTGLVGTTRVKMMAEQEEIVQISKSNLIEFRAASGIFDILLRIILYSIENEQPNNSALLQTRERSKRYIFLNLCLRFYPRILECFMTLRTYIE